MSVSKYKAVIFDLDGTLLDSLTDLAESMNEVLAARGYPVHHPEAYRYFVGNGLEKLVIRTLPQSLRNNSEILTSCQQQMREIYNRRWALKSNLYPGIGELLNRLVSTGIRLAVLSNKPDNFTRKICEHFLAAWPFEEIRGATADIPLKPDPTGALKIAGEMDLIPADFIYLGDTATDMQTACRAGMYPVGVLWGFRGIDELKEHGAATLINTPAELSELLPSPDIALEKTPVNK